MSELHFELQPEEFLEDDNIVGLLYVVANMTDLPVEPIYRAIYRARALEAFWSSWKDVEASGVGYSASFTEAAKRLKELEA